MPITVRQRSIHLKNGPKRTTSFKVKKGRKASESEYLVTNAPTDLNGISYPGGAAALLLLTLTRLGSALWGHISDCDETYNYWEPLHYLVYGSGLQTWEYSPLYAIRSYATLWLFAVPAKILSLVFTPVTVFYIIRGGLAVLTALAELSFYKSICHEFGVHIGRIWLVLTITSAGCFASSAALLPSSWGGVLATAAIACWWRKRYPLAIVFTAINGLLSWPFTALLGLPIALDMIIMKQRILEFIKWCLICLITILLPTVIVDSWHYGRVVIAPLNIVTYNIFTDHGPDLYGTEPWTYYFVNGFLNFNVVWIMSLSCPLLLLACLSVTRKAAPRPSFCTPYWLSLQPLYIWLTVFLIQPHKEERFLYPVYSMVVLTGAISIDCVQKMAFAFGTEVLKWGCKYKNHYLNYTNFILNIFLLIATLGGISRISALYMNYRGPMLILHSLPNSNSDETVCFAKDWYRSPSSFHLPDESYRIRFVQSDFDGQMPVQYDGRFNATRLIHPYFNDLNKGDNSTYLLPTDCDYLVDSDIGDINPRQPSYYKDEEQWEIVNSVPILNAAKSHRLFRAFYIPYLSYKYCDYGSLYLLRSKIN